LNPAGQSGLDPLTFLLIFPLMQVIVDFFALAAGLATCAGFETSWVRLTFTVGAEKVKFLADRVNQPLFSRTKVVATWAVPSDEITEIVAEIGADEKP
jgi:hypothetical protein